MKLSIKDRERETILEDLKIANLKFQKTYPGDKPDRQPIHTVYGGANLFKSDTCIKMGDVALRSLQTYAPDFIQLAKLLQFEGHDQLPNEEKDIEALHKKLERLNENDKNNEPAWLSLFSI